MLQETLKKQIEHSQIAVSAVVKKALNLNATDVQSVILMTLSVHISMTKLTKRKETKQMRRMTEAEMHYYAEKQKQADKKAVKKAMCHGIVALTAILTVPVLCIATEISFFHIGLFIGVVIAAIYFIFKV